MLSDQPYAYGSYGLRNIFTIEDEDNQDWKNLEEFIRMIWAHEARNKKNNVNNIVPMHWCLHNKTPCHKAIELPQSTMINPMGSYALGLERNYHKVPRWQN